jgi:hypothetical protein
MVQCYRVLARSSPDLLVLAFEEMEMPAADSHVGVHGSHINIRSISQLFHMLSPAADWTLNISRHLSNLRGEF